MTFDGVKVSGYMLASIGTGLTIGTFVHETGHLIFGWPDLYDYDSDSRGAGSFCLMSGQHSKNPQPPNAHFRAGQGWEAMRDLRTAGGGRVQVPSNGRANFRFAQPGQSRGPYVIENIARKGRWANMPDDGLMIWHVDEGEERLAGPRPGRRTAYRWCRPTEVRSGAQREQRRQRRPVPYGQQRRLFRETAPDSRWWSERSRGST